MFVYVIYGHPFKLGTSTSPGSTASSPRPSVPLRRISALSAAPGNQRASVSSLDYETDVAAASIDYGVGDPSFLREQPDVGAQEPDATATDDPYYTEGAYYYVQAADDDQE